jgi:hypothetical protein
MTIRLEADFGDLAAGWYAQRPDALRRRVEIILREFHERAAQDPFLQHISLRIATETP